MFHTYRSRRCPEQDQALLDFLQPVVHQFNDTSGGRIVDSYIAAIDLLKASGKTFDYVVLVRFEGLFRNAIDELDIRWICPIITSVETNTLHHVSVF